MSEGTGNVLFYKSAGFSNGCQKNSRFWYYQGGYIHLSKLLMCGFVLNSSRRNQAAILWLSCSSSKPYAGLMTLTQLVILWHADNELFPINLILASVLNFPCKCILHTSVRAYTTCHVLWKLVKLTWIKWSRWAMLYHTFV